MSEWKIPIPQEKAKGVFKKTDTNTPNLYMDHNLPKYRSGPNTILTQNT